MSKNKKRQTIETKPVSFDFEVVQLIMTLIDRERLTNEEVKEWYPHSVQEQYLTLIYRSGNLMSQIIPPEAVDQFLEMFPHLYRYFDGIDFEQVKVWKDKKYQELDVSIPTVNKSL